MRITIVLPAYFTHPIGGYHVHYSYANLLQARGHQVTIVFPRHPVARSSWKGRLWTPVWALRTRVRNRPLIPSFKLGEGVRVRFQSDLGGRSLPRADALIATAWQTAEFLRDAPADRGRKHYIVYDYEFWRTAKPAIRERIERTYSDDFRIVATSGAVEAMLRQCGAEPVARIPCGVDFESFGLDVPAAERTPLTLGFPVRHEPFKGTADAVAAAARLRERYGDKLRVTAFGSAAIELPPWIHRLVAPSQAALRAFYNGNAVFMVPSHFEGWGLPGAEAMACGAAVVTTDNGGCADYAIPGATALVVPPRQPERLADAVDRLLANDDLRVTLAQRGHESIQRFRWDTSAEALERLLLAA